MDYEPSFRLVVTRPPDAPHFLAQWVDRSGSESVPFQIELPLSTETAAELRWYLESYRGFVGAGTRVRARAAERLIEWLGRQLFSSCFAGTEGRRIHVEMLAAAREGQQVLLTLSSNESRFLQQPWELMDDSAGPLALRGITIRRQVPEAGQEEAPPPFALPIRLLLIVARPQDLEFIDPRSSMGPLLDALELLPAEVVHPEYCQPPTFEKLAEVLARAQVDGRPFHVVHFDGHGIFRQMAGKGALCFEDDDHHPVLVTGRRFGKLLARHKIPLVILEACRTSDLSEAPVFGSLAPALLESGVGSVVAFSHRVSVVASRILVESFYRGLASGLSVGQALAVAREALWEKPQRPLHLGPNAASIDLQDWFIAQLYQGRLDPALLGKLELPIEASATPRPEGRMFGFPPQPKFRFHGRARDLLELEWAFEESRGVLLSAGGGMGKTALAREAAFWWLRTGFFESAVFVSFEQVVTVERVVQELGRALAGVSFSSLPREQQEQEALRLFHDCRVLLVWDNFESTLPQFQVGEAAGPAAYPEEERKRLLRLYESLVEGEGMGRLLVTCRPADAQLPGIAPRALRGLERPDSLNLVQAIADARNIDLERPGCGREEVEKLLDLLDDHPLSISLVGPHLKSLEPAAIRQDFAGLLERFRDPLNEVERNQSLRASLEFSTARLSSAAQAVLPWLAWFQSGAFEKLILEFTDVSRTGWPLIRDDLEATGLLTVESVAEVETPFLRFHPMLPYAAGRQSGEVAEKRFVALYMVLMVQIDDTLEGTSAARGMAILQREEANFREALATCFRRGESQFGWAFADTLIVFLRMADRLRERDALVDWLAGQFTLDEVLDTPMCAVFLEHSLSLARLGRANEAIVLLKNLIGRVRADEVTEVEDRELVVGISLSHLAQVQIDAGRPDLAIDPSKEAIEILERSTSADARDNLSNALFNLANACRLLNRLDDAQAAAARVLAINSEGERGRRFVSGLDLFAEVLREQQRWTEAELFHAEALRLARIFDDAELEAMIRQHQGSLQMERGNPDEAALRYEEAILLSQKAGDLASEALSCDLLATAEMDRGRLDVAEAWYARSREISLPLKHRAQLAATAQNLGILHQIRANLSADPGLRQASLRRAVASLEESLAIEEELQDRFGAAASQCQLGKVHLMLGDLDEAECLSRRALHTLEDLNKPDVWKIYGNLSDISRARGDTQAAAEWMTKRDTKLAELEKLRGRPQDNRVGGFDQLPAAFPD